MDACKTMKVQKVLDFKVENGEKLYYVKYQPRWVNQNDPSLDENLVDNFWDVIGRSFEIMSKTFSPITSPPMKRDVSGIPVENVESNSMTGVIQKTPPSTPKKGRGRGRGKKVVTFNAAVDMANERPTFIGSALTKQILSADDKMEPVEKIALHNITNDVPPLDADMSSLDLNLTPVKDEKPAFNPVSPIKTETPHKAIKVKSPPRKSPKKEITVESWDNPYVNIFYYCRYCAKPCGDSLQRKTLKTHYESHFNLKNIGCYVCNMRFRVKSEAKSHIVKEHKMLYQPENLVQFNDKVSVPVIPIDEHGENIYVSPYVSHSFKCKICACDLPRNAQLEWKNHFESHASAK